MVTLVLLRPNTSIFGYVPLQIHVLRVRIACRYIFNLLQLHQGFHSKALWLEHWIFIRADQFHYLSGLSSVSLCRFRSFTQKLNNSSHFYGMCYIN